MSSKLALPPAAYPRVIDCAVSTTSASLSPSNSTVVVGAGSTKSLIIQKYIGWSLLLFNGLYLVLLALLLPRFCWLLLSFLPITAAYAISLMLAFVGIKVHWPRLLWPLLILQLLFVLILLCIFWLFLFQMVCQRQSSSSAVSVEHNGTFGLECPHWLAQKLNISGLSLDEGIPPTNLLLFIATVAIEKAAELVLFYLLMRRIKRHLCEQQLLMAAAEASRGQPNGSSDCGQSGETTTTSNDGSKKRRKRRPPPKMARDDNGSHCWNGMELAKEQGTTDEEEADEKKMKRASEKDEEEEEEEDTVYEKAGGSSGNDGGGGFSRQSTARLSNSNSNNSSKKARAPLPTVPAAKGRRVIA